MDSASSGHSAGGAAARAGVAAEPLVVLENVGRHYVIGERKVIALDGVNLSIHPGEFVAVLGPSGSGKTTLLNMIGALDTATTGNILIGGRQVTGGGRRQLAEIRRRQVSFIFQTFNLFPGLTALENVMFGAEVAGRKDPRGAALEVLESVDLGARVEHFPHELSGGEQQRVAIARALATGNPVLLADEPTGELDFKAGVQILQLLHEQTHGGSDRGDRGADGGGAPGGRAVVVVTHNREIARTADRVIELSSGRLVSDAPPPGGPADISELHW